MGSASLRVTKGAGSTGVFARGLLTLKAGCPSQVAQVGRRSCVRIEWSISFPGAARALVLFLPFRRGNLRDFSIFATCATRADSRGASSDT